jgi:hypothetical protein
VSPLPIAAAVMMFVAAGAADVRAATLFVSAGGNLQAALDAAQPGDEIVLEKGARFVGAFQLPPKPDGPVITIRTQSALGDRRVRWPEDGPKMAVVVSGTVEAALTGRGVSNWRIDGIRFESNAFGQGNVIELQDATNITIDRVIIVAGMLGQKRAILGNGQHITLTRSHIANIWHDGQDSQAFLAYDGAGPYTIVDNYLEAASENVMFGGADSAAADRLPSDILVEANHFSKRLEWRGVARNVKNLFELKAARRVTIRNNLFENNWTDGQPGWAIVFTPRNQDGSAPWTVVEDVLFEKNLVRDTERGINLIGYDYSRPSGRATRITINNNRFITAFNFMQAGGEIGELTLEHNTIQNGGPFVFLYAGGVWPASTGYRQGSFAIERLTVRNNLAYGHNGGLIGDGATPGNAALQRFAPGYVWTHNVLAGAPAHPYPVVTLRPTVAEYEAQFNGGTLIGSSLYNDAATDGADLGTTVPLELKAPGNLRLSR